MWLIRHATVRLGLSPNSQTHKFALTLQVCVFGFKGIAYFDALVIDLEEVAVFFL